MVSTAARKVSGVEEDIFFFLGLATAVAARFIELPQAFHQQTLSIQGGRLLLGSGFEIDLEIAAGPAQDLKNRGIALERAIYRMRDLPFLEIHLALFIAATKRERATFAAHFERLHEIDHVHLRKIAANHTIRG